MSAGSEPVTDSDSQAAPAVDPLAPIVQSVCPEPEPEVMAAIVAAVVECWPRPAPAPAPAPPSATALWRFSGRWWAKPSAARRERPWIGGTR